MFTVKINLIICFNKSRMRIKKQKVYFESKIMSDIKTSIHNTFILYTIFFFCLNTVFILPGLMTRKGGSSRGNYVI